MSISPDINKWLFLPNRRCLQNAKILKIGNWELGIGNWELNLIKKNNK